MQKYVHNITHRSSMMTFNDTFKKRVALHHIAAKTVLLEKMLRISWTEKEST